MTAKTKSDLKLLPGHSQGVRVNAAIRDVILAQPICPKSQIRGKMVDGHYEAPEIGPDDSNCQLRGGDWWVDCEAKGHDPYFRTQERIVTRPTYAEDEAGDLVEVSTKKVLLRDRVLNVTSVSTNIRLGSGQAVRYKKRKFGFRSLEDMGYAEVCQYRGCQKPIRVKNARYGNFCSTEELQLVAADVEEVLLSRTDHGLDVGSETKSARRRRNQLRQAVDGVNVDA